MKYTILFLLAAFCLSFTVNAQETPEKKAHKLPVVNVKTLDGKIVSTSTFTNDPDGDGPGLPKPIILSFWATWCKPCVSELTTISDVYEDWQAETGVKLIAVSIDDSRTSAGVKPLVDGKGWEYEIYLDVNSDFKRAMNINLVPHTFVLNGNGEIVWQHTTFSQGAELGLIDIVRKVIAGEPIPQE